MRPCSTPRLRIASHHNAARAYRTKAADEIREAFKFPAHAGILTSVSSPESLPNYDHIPEVAVTGRANVGKSTLLNAVFGRTDLAHSSKKAGHTRTLNFFHVGQAPGKLIIVDSPGYGYRGRQEWGELWDHYVDTRRSLKQICILINAPHGLTDFDRAMLENLNSKVKSRASDGVNIVLQPVLTKLDQLKISDDSSKWILEIKDRIRQLSPLAEEPLMCAFSNRVSVGAEGLREAMVQACTKKSYKRKV